MKDNKNSNHKKGASPAKKTTEPKKSDNIILKDTAIIHEIIDSFHDAIIITDSIGEIKYWNEAARKMFGHKKEEAIGKIIYKFLGHKKIQKDHSERFKELKKTGKVPFDEAPVEILAVRKDGAEFPVESSISTIMINGELHTIGTTRDITKRKTAEEEAAKSYKNQLVLNSLLQISLENISIKELLERSLDMILSVSWLNILSKGGIFLVGDEPDVLLLKTHRKLNQNILKTCARIPFGECLCGKTAETGKILFADRINSEHTTKYKGIKPHGHFIIPILSEGGVLGVIVLYLKEGHRCSEHEITFLETVANTLATLLRHKQSEEERENLWQQLLQFQKLESIGRLTGGMAHDFNNLLTSIIGYSEMALEELSDTHPAKKKIRRINYVGKKASALTDQLLAFSRQQVLEMEVKNLNNIVENMSDILIRIMGEDISLELNIDSSIGNVMIDESQIELVFMNIIINSKDAMPDGGHLLIETTEVKFHKEEIKKLPGIKSGRYVKLSITDTGIGMNQATQDKIFDPFFTTKKKGKGSGLGLSTVLGVIKQHNGYIKVESKLDKGTAFSIYLPVINDKAKDTAKEEVPFMKGGSETILIVEDHFSIRKLFVDILKPLGYRVLEADSSEDALKISDSMEGTIDLLLADVVMQGMNGWELAEIMKRKRPKMKVIFTSGYIENPVVLNNIQKAGLPFIKKPFSPRVLVKTIHEALNE
jgi:PAS domain S-box-containing protein